MPPCGGVARSRRRGRPGGARESPSRTGHTETGIAVKIQSETTTVITLAYYQKYNTDHTSRRPPDDALPGEELDQRKKNSLLEKVRCSRQHTSPPRRKKHNFFTPGTDDLYDLYDLYALFPLDDLDPSGHIYS